MTEKPARPPEDGKRKTRCAIVGPRPVYLLTPEDDVRVDLENAIMAAIRDGFTSFITGGTYGVGIWAEEIVMRLQSGNPAIHLIAVIPFPGYEELWTDEWKARYNTLLAAADYVVFMKEEPCRQAWQARIEWMVAHAARLIAIDNGEPGSVRDAIACARKHRVNIRILRG